jgi:hypothetical protein
MMVWGELSNYREFLLDWDWNWLWRLIVVVKESDVFEPFPVLHFTVNVINSSGLWCSDALTIIRIPSKDWSYGQINPLPSSIDLGRYTSEWMDVTAVITSSLWFCLPDKRDPCTVVGMQPFVNLWNNPRLFSILSTRCSGECLELLGRF